MKTTKWFKDCFILVTTTTREESGGYKHPRLSVHRLYDDTKYRSDMHDRRLPANPAEPTTHAQTLIAFEFQQNRRQPNGDDHNARMGEPYLCTDENGHTPSYAGHLDTDIKVEPYGVNFDLVSKLRDIDRALKTYNARLQKLNAKRPECELTVLMNALRTVWKVPVLFVCWTGSYGEAVTTVNPDVNVPTWSRLRRMMEQRERAVAEGFKQVEQADKTEAEKGTLQ